MPLIKPSEFFNNKNSKSSPDNVKEELSIAAPKKVEKISEAFDSFKSNLNHLQKLTEFTDTFDSFKSNVEKINHLSEGIESLKEEIKDFVRKEDIDDALMAQIFFIEESIKDVQEKVKVINSKSLLEMKKEILDISSKVDDFVNLEIPSQKNLVLESETRIDNRFLHYKTSVDSKIEKIDDEISDRFLVIAETLQGINNQDLESIRNEVDFIDKKVDSLVETEIPNYKKFITESALRTEEKLLSSEELVEKRTREVEENCQSQIKSIKEEIETFISTEIPKYRDILFESKIQVREDIDNIEEKIDQNISTIFDGLKSLESKIESKDLEVDKILSNKISEIKNFIDESKDDFESISKTYKNLYKDFKNREVYENEKLEKYSNTLESFSNKLISLENTLTEDISGLQESLDISTSKYYDVLKKEVGFFEQNISDKIKDLEVNIVVNESHINKIKNSVYEILDNLKLDLIEEKSKELNDKIRHVEKILKKFDEKTLLEEQTFTISNPPSSNTSDPLTPLDKNYVTLKDLQDHYRLFINRVQQQLSTIGGGGAGFMYDLADVGISTISNGDILSWNSSNNMWEPTAGLGKTTLVTLNDVDISNIGDGRFLRYDASTSKFTFAPVSATNLELAAGDIQSGILTTSSTSPSVVMSISASTYRSVNYKVQVTEGTNYNMTTINVIHDGTNTYMSEYGTINQPIGVATFSSDISGGSLRLIAYPSFASSTTFKVVFTAIEA